MTASPRERKAAPIDAFGVILKVRIAPEDPSPSTEQIARLAEAFPGPADDRRLTGGGRDFTAWFWVEAADASEAIQVAYAALRRSADDLELPAFQIIRAHSAAESGRAVEVYPGTHQRVGDPDAWSAQVKLAAPDGSRRADAALMDGFRAALADPRDALLTLHGDPVKFLGDEGSGFTARYWISAPDAPAALRSAKRAADLALARLDLTRWSPVRAHLATARERAQDDFPGSARRAISGPER